MTTNSNLPAPKFRGDSVLAVDRNGERIVIWARETRINPDKTVSTVRVLDPIVLAFDALSASVRAEGFGYGIETALTRRAALPKDTRTGRPAPVSEKHAAIKELADHWASGTDSWTMASAGISLSPDTRALIEAVQRAYGLEADAAEAAIREMSTRDRDALRVDGEIKPHLDAVYAQRAASAGPVEDLKAKLKALKTA